MRNFIRIARGTIKRLYRRYSTQLQLCWVRVFWIVAVSHDDEYRCATISFESGDIDYFYDISENEYLYDLDAAILRKYKEFLVPSEKAKKSIGSAKNRLKRDKQTKREWSLGMARKVKEHHSQQKHV